MQVLLARLLPLASVVTPNRAEAAVLTGLPMGDTEGAARALRRLGAAAAVVTGGDILGDADPVPHASESAQYSEDVLAYAASGHEFVETLSSPRLRSSSTHGTGCAFSSAIACALAQGHPAPAAVTSAKAFVGRAIQQAPGLGHGRGPMALERAGE